MPEPYRRQAYPEFCLLGHILQVFPGDVIVGDDDGVMVIPQHLADKVAAEAKNMELYEAFVTESVLEGTPLIGLYPLTSDEHKKTFELWKKQIDDNI